MFNPISQLSKTKTLCNELMETLCLHSKGATTKGERKNRTCNSILSKSKPGNCLQQLASEGRVAHLGFLKISFLRELLEC